MPSTLPQPLETLQSLAVALALGLLVGLQREWVRSRVAGIRTFAMVSLFGGLSGLLGISFGGWVLAAALVAMAGLVILATVAEQKLDEADFGLTTEVAMLVMFAVGTLSVLGHRLTAVVVAATVMLLLHSKKPLHRMVHRIGTGDLREIARLVLAGLVILPLLPNEDMGYLGVLNPFSIWLMVVLIIGISLAAYLARKFLGAAKGAALAGIFGGLVSSTATMASIARRSNDAGASGLALAAIALTASAIVFVRVMIEVAIAAPGHIQAMLPPVTLMMLWFAAIAVIAHRIAARKGGLRTPETPPSELKSAVVFGLLYAVVLVIVAAAREHFGQSGLYLAAGISGLTDMDAITLSTSRLVNTGHLETGTAWRMILVGGMANVVFKMGLALVLGARAFLIPLLTGMGASLAGAVAILMLWPW